MLKDFIQHDNVWNQLQHEEQVHNNIRTCRLGELQVLFTTALKNSQSKKLIMPILSIVMPVKKIYIFIEDCC